MLDINRIEFQQALAHANATRCVVYFPDGHSEAVDLSLGTKPTAPIGLIATGSDMGVGLSWAPNPTSENVAGYIVYSAPASTGPFTQTATPLGTSYFDASMAVGETRYYSLRAANTFGNSPPSTNVSAT